METPLENAVGMRCGRVASLFSKLLWAVKSYSAAPMSFSWVGRGIVRGGGGVLYSVDTAFRICGARTSEPDILMQTHGSATVKCSWYEMRACGIIV